MVRGIDFIKVAQVRPLVIAGISYREAARQVGVHEDTLHRWRRRGLIPRSTWKPEDSPHGTYGRYVHGRCRCADCRSANAREFERQRAKRSPENFTGKHGHSAYVNWKCRCDICVAARAEYMASRR